MLDIFATLDPIVVEVYDNGTYDVFGNDTPRSHWLYDQIKIIGGISDQVDPGNYYFNIIPEGGKNYAISLVPIK
jgi:hypothetical protein